MAISRPWQDKQTLYDMYCIKKKTITEIAQYFTDLGYPVTSMTIFNNLKKYDLVKNSRNLGKRSVGGNDKSRKGGFYGR